MVQMVQVVLTIMQAILAFCNLCMMIYLFFGFLKKPHDTLEQRVTVLEVKQKENEDRLNKGNDRFRELDSAIDVVLQSIIALIKFEFQFCSAEHKEISEGLKEAEKKLDSYLAGSRR